MWPAPRPVDPGLLARVERIDTMTSGAGMGWGETPLATEKWVNMGLNGTQWYFDGLKGIELEACALIGAVFRFQKLMSERRNWTSGVRSPRR